MQAQQWWLNALEVHKAWTISKGAGVTVAVIDSGVDGSFGDLQGALVPGFDANAVGVSGDGQRDTDPAVHGTRMADTIGGRGTGFGLLGIAPEAKILPVAMSAGADEASVVTALNHLSAMAHPPQVVSMSVNADEDCPSELRDAIARAVGKGMILVNSAGNDGETSNASTLPANCGGVVVVGAIDKDGKTWSGSTRNAYVALGAPGVHMIGYDAEVASGYGYADGTSDAAAVVAGIMALVRSHYPRMSSRDVVARVLYTTHQTIGNNDTRNPEVGYGIALPFPALTMKVPANAPNPIYDELKPPAGPSPTTHPVTTHPASPSAPQSTAVAADPPKSGGGSDTGIIIGVIAGVAVVMGLVALLVVRRRPSRG